MLDFSGKNAVITGGSRGIGRAIALGLAKQGANILISYVSHDAEADEVLEAARGYGVNAYKIKVDQSDPYESISFADKAIETLGKVHVLVDNAGICPFENFFKISVELFEKVWKVNVESHFFITQRIANNMIENKIRGRILLISSISAHVGGEFQTHYTTTKSALNGFMHSLAIVLGKYGILVNSLEPGTILTDINKEDLSNKEKREYMERRTVVGRLGLPEDMVAPALFLVSDDNTYVTGTELLADGGMLINLQ